ncbi:MAG TPA: hypothetical protein VGA20_10560 [Gemmatimonadales bacterium]
MDPVRFREWGEGGWLPSSCDDTIEARGGVAHRAIRSKGYWNTYWGRLALDAPDANAANGLCSPTLFGKRAAHHHPSSDATHGTEGTAQDAPVEAGVFPVSDVQLAPGAPPEHGAQTAAGQAKENRIKGRRPADRLHFPLDL